MNDRSRSDPESLDRQQLYAIALKRFFKIAPPICQIIIADNTVSGLQCLSEPLKNELKNPRVIDILFTNDNKIGGVNKGASEYLMCEKVVVKHRDYIRSSDWIIWYTSRHLISFPMIFDYLNEYSEFDALVGNPSYFFSDGTVLPSAKGNFAHMLLAMKPQIFLKYADAMNPDYLLSHNMNSEMFLYNFIHQNNISFKKLPRLGVLRFDYHICRTAII